MTKRIGWAVIVHYAHTTQHVSGKKPMVKHLGQDVGDFLPSHNRRNETPASIALETMLHYKQAGSMSARDWLIEYYMHTFVKSAARRIAAGLPSCIDADDLEQVGFFGLVDCIEKYDPSRNFKFETYARQRVEGSMRDYLRREDPASRLARTRTKLIARGIEEFKAQHGRVPTDYELQQILQLDGKDFAAVMRDVHVPNTLPFHPTNDDESGEGLAEMSIELKNSGHEHVDRLDLHGWLCAQLGTYDTLIVVLTYTEGLTMLEIGHTLGYSESRVSQRLKHIHAVLKSKISDEMDDWWLRAS
jgi:RNA polymerase sigma factor for flagellar operon FliA